MASWNPSMAFPDKGYQFPLAPLVLDGPTLAAYRQAVEDEALASLERRLKRPLVPPLAVAAAAFRSLLERMELPPGAVHTGQELAFRRLLEPGQRLELTASVSGSASRGGWRFINVDMRALDGAGQVVMAGRASLMLPEAAEGPSIRGAN